MPIFASYHPLAERVGFPELGAKEQISRGPRGNKKIDTEKGRRRMSGTKAVTWRGVAGRVAGVLAATMMLAAVSVAPAQAQGLSDKAVNTFMRYAWMMTPQKFTKPNGKTVIIDKKKKDEVMVSTQQAREVIMTARLTAHAQICNLPGAQLANYQSMMRRLQLSKKWSEPQIIFMNQLHLTTVMMLTGKIQVVEKKDGKQVVVDEKKAKLRTCTEEERKKVKKLIIEYLKSEPKWKNTKKQG